MSALVVTRIFFFFQAEDGIRFLYVTGVQTCALPIFGRTIIVAVAVTCVPGAPDETFDGPPDVGVLACASPAGETAPPGAIVRPNVADDEGAVAWEPDEWDAHPPTVAAATTPPTTHAIRRCVTITITLSALWRPTHASPPRYARAGGAPKVRRLPSVCLPQH